MTLQKQEIRADIRNHWARTRSDAADFFSGEDTDRHNHSTDDEPPELIDDGDEDSDNSYSDSSI
jgi:hypothetical protein